MHKLNPNTASGLKGNSSKVAQRFASMVKIDGEGKPREVSQQAATRVVEALSSLGYRTGVLELNKDLATDPLRLRPDVVMSSLRSGMAVVPGWTVWTL
jgi:hypothetical protein